VLGCAGSGKTTFARKLSDRIGAPFICLDEIWQPSWGKSDVPKFRSLVADAHAGDEWVSDGNFAVATFDIRLPRADLIVWLERPRLVCAWRAITRVFKTNEAHALRNLPKVLAFIHNFDRVNRPLIERAREEHGPEVPMVWLRNDREIDAFLGDLIQA
jgi:adenylate kinase family enzyme